MSRKSFQKGPQHEHKDKAKWRISLKTTKSEFCRFLTKPVNFMFCMCKTEVWIPEMGKVVNLSLDRNNIQMSVIAGLVKVSFKTVRSSSKIRICDESL